MTLLQTSTIVEWEGGAHTDAIERQARGFPMTTTRPGVLVLGANGRFGRAAVRAFAAAGWPVFAQARRTPVDALPPRARHVGVALGDGAASLARAAAGANVVVHAINPPYTRWRQDVLSLAQLGMDIAMRLGARFMLPGNVYNFGASMPARLLETTPQSASTAKGRIRCDLEAAMQARASTGLRSLVIRAGDFFGGGTGSWFDRVIARDLPQGRLVYPGPTDVPHAWAYLPDLARACVALAEIDTLPNFASYHFTGHTITGAQMLDGLERAAGELGLTSLRRWRHGTMPWGLLRAGAWLVPMWRELVEMEYLWRVPHALDGNALRAVAGALPVTPIDAALRAALLGLGFGDHPSKALAGAA
jgi:nucleoside-diphosphate-sugar epimerase